MADCLFLIHCRRAETSLLPRKRCIKTPFFLRDSGQSETRARVKIIPREKGETGGGGGGSYFHARSRFARSTIHEGKWGLLVVYLLFGDLMTLFSRNRKSVSCFFLPQTSLSQKANTQTHWQPLVVYRRLLCLPQVFRRIETNIMSTH